MSRQGVKSAVAGAISVFVFLFLFGATAQAQLILPYVRMAKAAASDESIISQARSQATELKWKADLLAAEGIKGLRLKTFVLMQRGFVVGFVDSQSQQDTIKTVSHSVPLRSLDVYLPVRTHASEVSEADLGPHDSQPRTPAFLVKMQIKSALLQQGLKEPLKVDVVVLHDTAVLVGIVDDEGERQLVLETARRTKAIRQVVDFLLLPEPGYKKLLR